MGLSKFLGKVWNKVVGNNNYHEEVQTGKTLAQAIGDASGVANNLNTTLNNHNNSLAQIETKFKAATQQLAQSERNLNHEQNQSSYLNSQISSAQSRIDNKLSENSALNSQLLILNAELEQQTSILLDKKDQEKDLKVIQAASNEDVLSDINQLAAMEENLIKLEKVEDELIDHQRLLQTTKDYYEQFCSVDELEEEEVNLYQEQQYQMFQEAEQEILGEILKNLEHL